MDVFDIIKNRRSVMPYQYNDVPIKEDDLFKILEAANWAPTHKKTEPWRFKVFKKTSKEKLGKFLADKYIDTSQKQSEFRYKKIIEKFSKSYLVIAICMQRDPKRSIPEWEEIASVSMAVQNMWLMASQMKIGSYWSSPSYMNYLGDFIPLSKDEKCLGFFYMGHYSGDKVNRIPGSFNDKVQRFN